eukprot:CAMPEP_0178640048 /NCGR_PEP_ID=MMETSP0698-20121128/15802_1 /TAXON_ID=265572 /ORGANISM="Extubocellulus spinifer, Strain CCMP396" /LENGTH=145 /DNA_ID=CAMNT_0020280449 /DNA_START=186 /DNA_END=621 /DNA_ORIENTATION=+
MTTAALTLYIGSSREMAMCNGSSDENSDVGDYEVDEDCPFCRFFLESPCKRDFITWHACIKRSDKPTDCMEQFRPLKACMDDNGMTMSGEEIDEEDDEDNSTYLAMTSIVIKSHPRSNAQISGRGDNACLDLNREAPTFMSCIGM